jgi:hypothetical protein
MFACRNVSNLIGIGVVGSIYSAFKNVAFSIASDNPDSIFQFDMNRIDGAEFGAKDIHNKKVFLIVNVASK